MKFFYCTISPNGRHIKQFKNDDEAFEWNQSFTDGPALYPIEKLIGGKWVGWRINQEKWDA